GSFALFVCYDTTAASSLHATQEMNFGRRDFGADALLASTVGVLFQPQTTFDVNLTALDQVFVGQLGLPSPGCDAEPGRVLFHFACDVLTLFGRGDGHFAKSRAL